MINIFVRITKYKFNLFTKDCLRYLPCMIAIKQLISRNIVTHIPLTSFILLQEINKLINLCTLDSVNKNTRGPS